MNQSYTPPPTKLITLGDIYGPGQVNLPQGWCGKEFRPQKKGDTYLTPFGTLSAALVDGEQDQPRIIVEWITKPKRLLIVTLEESSPEKQPAEIWFGTHYAIGGNDFFGKVIEINEVSTRKLT